MKTSIRRKLIIAGLAAGLSASFPLAASAADSATIRVAYNLPKDHATGLYFETLAKKIEELTASTALKLKVRTFPNGQLYNDTQLPDAVSTGAVEIGQMNIGFMNGPGTESLRIWGLPFLYNSWEALWATEDNPAFKGAFDRQFGKFGMHMLGWVQYGLVEFYASKPIALPADLKGLRMRAFGVDTSMLIRDLGGSPVSLSSQEMYQAVQRGTIDGFITGPTSVYSRKLYEVTKHGTDIGINYLSFMATANLEWWNKLPDDTRKAVAAASDIAQTTARERAKEDDRIAKQHLKELGVSVSELSPEQRQQWVDASKGLYDAYREKAGTEGAELLKIVEAADRQQAAK
ncbi:TRAP transporter substrate-binding protein [Pollutimonas bauzanensis]|uniref:TRAP-type C4-dicarboxylate transport system, substrate-binding protein n=1 Tax=Pollutimonas bauzanensis TaxID=658167 RepID=A0A1M5Y6S4_9BURK|nr:TRAP transporter substrate-binding protein DctP [Pollutimonas bauzanensis]SHI07666.1 TRAP-type C4-dicarboxylate transport system, substrate-binding protein [Pollutimonas bauzanensis]